MNYTLRIEKLRNRLVELGADFYISERPLDLRYFCGMIDPRGLLIIPAYEEATLFVPAAVTEEAKYLVQTASICPITIGKPLSCNLHKIIKRPCLVFLGEISEQTRKTIQDFNPKYQFKDLSSFADTLQRCKSAEEIAYICKAVEIAESGIRSALQIIKTHISELELAAHVTKTMMINGAETLWSPVQVLSGYRSVFADAKTSRKLIESDESCIIDVGPLFEGYTGDLTRSFTLGKLSKDQKQQLEWTKEAQNLALTYVKEGMAVAKLYQLVMNYFEKLGVSQYFPHALGHGLGLLSACSPFLRPDVNDYLVAGDVITIEPGLYIPGRGGCRIEDVVIVTNNGFDRISSLSIPWEIC